MINSASDLHFAIFKDVDDFKKWDKYLEYIQLNPEINEEKRELLLEMYQFFRLELGKDYLGRCRSDGKNLVKSWLHSRGNSYSQLQWLFNGMKYFKNRESNYIALTGHLKSCKKCNSEGIPFLIVGDSLRKTGFEVIFEPKMNITGFKKQPDLKVTDIENQETIYIEVSKLNHSKYRDVISSNFYTILAFFRNYPPYVLFTGKMHRTASTEELLVLKELIFKTRREALEQNLFIQIGIEQTSGIMEFGVAHNDKRQELEEWEMLKHFGGLDHLKSLPIDFNYTRRMRLKLKDEAEQIPPNNPGIIYMPVPSEYIFFGVSDLEELLIAVKKFLEDEIFSNIFGVCIYSHILHRSEDILYEEGDFFERKMVHENIQQDVIFIRNEGCKVNILPNTISKIKSSFRNIFC